jgi:N-acetylglucosaminyl-diphospho-decaprenol L-rhamnosyltransferase
MLRILMLAHNAAAITAEAVDAALAQLPDGGRLLLLDNGSEPAQAALLAQLPTPARPGLDLLHSVRNLGYAGGMNLLLERALAGPGVDAVLLLNNDALLQPGAVPALLDALGEAGGSALVGARMMQWRDPAAVDSLGIALYRSGIASNRTGTQQRLLGPTGGCMLLGRRVLEDLRDSHGGWFDDDFFCYAEDTDLVLRARWLGHRVALAERALVLHHGSLSSGGADNEFVLYHGIRNSIWALAKNAPGTWLLAFSPWIVVAHGGVVLRNLRKGRWRTLGRLYRDALAGLPAMWRKRRRIRASRRLPAAAWWSWVEPRLYDPGFLRAAWRELIAGRRR